MNWGSELSQKRTGMNPENRIALEQDEDLRTPHTIPYSSGYLEYEKKHYQLMKIQKDVPLVPEIVKYIVGEELFREDKTEVEPEESESDDFLKEDDAEDEEESEPPDIPGEVDTGTWTERRPTAGRLTRPSFLKSLGIKAKPEEKPVEYQEIRPLVDQWDEESKEESEEEMERPYYDIETRRRELMKQEMVNNGHIQELYNNLHSMEVSYNEVKERMDRDIKRLLKDLRGFHEEDIEEIKADIDAMFKEEGISPTESVVDEDE